MSTLLRFNGAVRREPAIDRWFSGQQPDLAGIARRWFDEMRRCGDEVRELMHDGCPTVCVGDAGFAYVNVFRSHVNVGFFLGTLLPDPSGLLEGTGKRMRHVKIRPGTAFDAAALETLIAAAHRDMVTRVQAGE